MRICGISLAPISVIITTLAAWSYEYCVGSAVFDSELDVLCAVIRHMPNFIGRQVVAGHVEWSIWNETTEGENFAERWNARMTESFTVVIRQPNDAVRVWWHVDLRTGSITRDDEPMAQADDEDGTETDWSIVGSVAAWLRLLDGDLNMSVALRCNELRYCDYGENDFFVTESRISLLAELLGLPSLPGSAAITGSGTTWRPWRTTW